MLSIEKLKIYSKYGGDLDLWTRSVSRYDTFITEKEWLLIDSLMQDFDIVKNGFASENYIVNLHKRFIDNFDNTETIKFFESLKK